LLWPCQDPYLATAIVPDHSIGRVGNPSDDLAHPNPENCWMMIEIKNASKNGDGTYDQIKVLEYSSYIIFV
jgi:hypothetical protein